MQYKSHRMGAGADTIHIAKIMHKANNRFHIEMLGALVDSRDEYGDFCFANFKSLSKEVGIPYSKVRRIVRHLARQELAEYANGLWTEDGKMAGAGYAATILGSAVYRLIKAFEENNHVA